MKEREIYADLRVLPPFIIRLDGRAFHHFCAACIFIRPYDERFADAMAAVTRACIGDSGLSPLFGFTFSDEISLYCREVPFDGRVEKIDSVMASFAASSLSITLRLDAPVAFDARVIPVHDDQVLPYLVWRQDEAWRNHMNSWSQYLLSREGRSPGEVAALLDGVGACELHEICHQRGVNLAKTPAWQRRGIMVRREEFSKEGYNPVTGEETITSRSRLVIDRDLPLFSKPDGEAYISGLLGD